LSEAELYRGILLSQKNQREAEPSKWTIKNVGTEGGGVRKSKLLAKALRVT